MDSRSTFLHQQVRVNTDGVTRKGRRTHDWTCAEVGEGGVSRQIREPVNTKARLEVRLRPNQLADLMPPRKTSRELISCPYRKPTQVDGERIPRRVSDLSLRNSAHWLRNFGIRSAPGR